MASPSVLQQRSRCLAVVPSRDALARVAPLLDAEHVDLRVATTIEAATALARDERCATALVDAAHAGARLPELVTALHAAQPLLQVVLLDGEPDGARARRLVGDLGLHAVAPAGARPGSVATALVAARETHDQLAQLHATERIKTELLGDVSHEFRTPLNVILGYLDLLREGAFGVCPPDATAVHEKLLGNASFLLEMVEEFLDLTRVEAGATPRRHEAVDVRPLLHDLTESFALLVQERPVAFRSAVPDDLPAVHGDPAKLRVIVQNLLTNAAKFTRDGHIELAAEVAADGRVAIHVRDTGPGIPVQECERIFELFQQAGTARDRAKGIGLGLALARRFAHVMHGDLTVASTVGIGTTFTVHLVTAHDADR